MAVTIGYWQAGPTLDVRVEDGIFWVTCPQCPGWSACAGSWNQLRQLVSEWHDMADATHRGWTMYEPFKAYVNAD